MSKTLSLTAERREQTGSKRTAKLRAAGRIPAIVYGHKQDAISISLDEHDFVEALHHGHRLLNIKLDGKGQNVLIKDLQYDHLGRDVIHADLIRVDMTELMTVNVPIELKGTAEGTHHGGIIEEHADSLELRCKVTDIPEVLVVSVKDVNIGDAIHAGDVELPAGVTLVSNPELVLVTCHVVAAAKSTEELEEEVPEAPEVIGEAEREAEAEEPAEQE